MSLRITETWATVSRGDLLVESSRGLYDVYVCDFEVFGCAPKGSVFLNCTRSEPYAFTM